MNRDEIWVEKYRPKQLEDVVADSEVLVKFHEYITNKEIPHLLFCGDAGRGKTTCAKILANAITDEILYINASDETSVDTIRNKVKNFCSTIAFTGLKIVILDEFDAMSQNAMMLLRNIMEEYADSSRFILTCNFERKILDPIKSRCQIFTFNNKNEKECMISVIKRCAFILKNEKVTAPNLKEDLTKLVRKYYPDIRKVINNLEKMTVNNEFKFTNTVDGLDEVRNKFIEMLKNCDIKTIRKEILGLGVDYNELYRLIFDRSSDISEENKIDIMLTVAEHSYRHSIVIDQEINFVACLISICKMK